MPAFRKDLKKMLASPSLTSGLDLAIGATKSIYCCGKGKLVKKHEKTLSTSKVVMHQLWFAQKLLTHGLLRRTKSGTT